MAPELEDHWFERSRKGRRCRTRTIAWQGRALTAIYSATAIYFVLLAGETRGGLCARRGQQD